MRACSGQCCTTTTTTHDDEEPTARTSHKKPSNSSKIHLVRDSVELLTTEQTPACSLWSLWAKFDKQKHHFGRCLHSGQNNRTQRPFGALKVYLLGKQWISYKRRKANVREKCVQGLCVLITRTATVVQGAKDKAVQSTCGIPIYKYLPIYSTLQAEGIDPRP